MAPREKEKKDKQVELGRLKLSTFCKELARKKVSQKL